MLDVGFAEAACIFIQFTFRYSGKRYAPLENAGWRPVEKSSVRNTAHNVTVPELSDGQSGSPKGFCMNA